MAIVTHTDLMADFRVLHLRFVAQAREAIQFGPQPGTNIRGALYSALCELFSPNEPISGLPLDPVRHLLAAENEDAARGRDMPRAFSIEPPPRSDYRTGQQFDFGVTLFGTGMDLIPYILRAVRDVADRGMGIGRGRIELIHIDEMNPLSLARRPIMKANLVTRPRLEVFHRQVIDAATQRMRDNDTLTLRFLTPTRLVEKGALAHEPALGILMRRLLERAQALVEYYSEPGVQVPSRDTWRDAWQEIGRLGDTADVDYLRTHWVDIHSFSQRRGRSTPIGGFVGEARWRHVAPPLFTWALWGQSLHVGKNAVKGDGWFMVR